MDISSCRGGADTKGQRVHNTPSNCLSPTSHPCSRLFFRAAATLAIIAGGISGALSTQALAVDYDNPLGTTVGDLSYSYGVAPVNITNAGTIGSLRLNFTTVTSLVNIYGGNISTINVSISLNDYSQITTLTNYGTIQGRRAVDLEYNSSIQTLSNYGSIVSSDWAILLNQNSSITTLNNTGNIIGAFDGINNQASGNTITLLNNSGTITGTARYGINSYGTITTLINSGTISGSAGFENGGTIGTLTNSGTINGRLSITGTGTIGTLNLLNGSVINGSFYNFGTIGTLNLLNGSVINGIFYNIGTIDTLNLLNGSVINENFYNYGTIATLNLTISGITSGNYNVLIPTISGNQPVSINIFGLPTNEHSVSATGNGRRASVDTSSFGANMAAVRNISGSVARLSNSNGLIQSIGAKAAKVAAAPYMTTSDLCADGAPAPAAQVGNSDLWIRGFTGRNRVDATTASIDYLNTYSGGAVGFERDWSADVRAGAFIGAGKNSTSLGGASGGNDSNLFFGGVTATKTWETTFAKVGLTAGRGNNDTTRNISGGTPETAVAEYNSWYVSPEASLGRVFALGQHLGGDVTLTPVLSVRYVYGHTDGYTETGATTNLTMNSSSSSTIEERAELKFSYTTTAAKDYGVRVNASIGAIGQQNNGGDMSGTLLGAPVAFSAPGQDNSTGFVGGFGVEVSRGKYTLTISADYVRLSGTNADLSGNVVMSVKF